MPNQQPNSGYGQDLGVTWPGLWPRGFRVSLLLPDNMGRHGPHATCPGPTHHLTK